MASSIKPDLMLVDLHMPEMTGHEVCRAIKENEETAHIPVIMFTAYTKTIDKVEALELGAADYMGKHFSFEEILARVKAALRTTSSKIDTHAAKEENKKIIALRSIIDTENIRILFQPIVDLSDKKPIGYEALTRGPRGTFLESPINLFDIATKSNMFFQLNELCHQMSTRKASFLEKNQTLFLNTDPGVIDTDYFRNLAFLNGSSLEPSQVCIEITERTCVTDFVKLSSRLDYVRSMGIKIAIDDVGAGYSSLKAIAQLKPDFIKADIALIRSIDKEKPKRDLLKLIAGLANNMNSRLVAEGIETEEELSTLMSIGVNYGQGFLFARPSETI